MNKMLLQRHSGHGLVFSFSSINISYGLWNETSEFRCWLFKKGDIEHFYARHVPNDSFFIVTAFDKVFPQ